MKTLWFVLLFSAGAFGATLLGSVYDENLDPATDALVTINTTPVQEIVTKNGGYQFEVAEGTYLLSAATANASAEKTVAITKDGTFRIDLVLLPEVNEDTQLLEDVLEASDVEQPAAPPSPWDAWPQALVLLFILAGAAYWVYQRKTLPEKQKAEPAPTSPPPSHAALTPDEQKMLRVLETFNGRAGQKDLRKAIPEWSEAKVSMELTELEDRGLIRKIRKGRGNIIKKA